MLLVDDEVTVRTVLARALRGRGFSVLEAADGRQALSRAHAFNGMLALVVTDVNMPVMDGFAFAEAFLPLYPSVPILFITGGDHPMERGGPGGVIRIAFPRGGYGEVLPKPFTPEVLLEAVSRIVGRGAGPVPTADRR